ncbi:hypothetical protein QR98_0103280 [Sarcoptes scabiei]|uniref:Uncharacterized protein n=1 Tax=Sarcoptes scabiei TaxID=52283 RepID=A0A132ALF9_SARSC|nr:hypothetical protein QR98_0103280 [Sarcoptes scabiei]
MTKIQNPEPLSELNHRQMFPLIVGADSQHAHHHHHQQQQHHHHRQMNGMSVVNRFGKKRMLSKKSHRNLRRNKPLTEIEMRQKELDQQEMQLLLAKLKQLVPGIPKNRRLSKLEIIQHVIDYIFDLQMALESHPIASTMAASVLAADFVANNFLNEHSDSIIEPSRSLSPPSTTISSNSLQCDRLKPNQSIPLSQRLIGSNRQPLASIVL